MLKRIGCVRAWYKKKSRFFLFDMSLICTTLTSGRVKAALGHDIKNFVLFFAMSLICTIFAVTNRPIEAGGSRILLEYEAGARVLVAE